MRKNTYNVVDIMNLDISKLLNAFVEHFNKNSKLVRKSCAFGHELLFKEQRL